MTSWTGVFPTIFNDKKKSKLGPEFGEFRLITLGPVGLTSNLSVWCVAWYGWLWRTLTSPEAGKGSLGTEGPAGFLVRGLCPLKMKAFWQSCAKFTLVYFMFLYIFILLACSFKEECGRIDIWLEGGMAVLAPLDPPLLEDGPRQCNFEGETNGKLSKWWSFVDL